MPLCDMHLHTFILDYGGGTYVSQIEADDERAAFSIWLSRLASHRIADAVSPEIGAAFEGYDGHDDHIDNPTALSGVQHVWCVSGTGSQGGIDLNIVRTAN